LVYLDAGGRSLRLSFSELRERALEGRAPLKLHATFSPSERVCARPEVRSVTPARFDGSAWWKDGAVYLAGTLSFAARLVCVRCLSEFERSFRVSVDEIFRRGAPAASAEDLPARELVEWVEEDAFDLLPHLEDWLILSLPDRPLCREDCKGLCPVCGKNLNEGPCGCKVEEVDPRLEALRALLVPEEPDGPPS